MRPGANQGPLRKNPLTPRETAMRLLEHMDESASYGDIIRQVRILKDIDQTMNDVQLVGFGGDDVVAEARTVGSWTRLADRADAGSTRREPSNGRGANSNPLGPDDGLDSLLRRAEWLH